MQQPYIFKKQLISLFICILLLIILFSFRSKYLVVLSSSYLLIILGIIFIPILRKKYKYPVALHQILYGLPFFNGLLFISSINIGILKIQIIPFLLITLFSLGLLFFSRKEIITELTSIKSNVPITIRNFLISFFYILYSIISEEVYFRLFLIGYFKDYFGLFSVLISSIFFIHAHYINRWANIAFTKKAYFLQFLLSILIGVFFFYTDSLLLCIFSHLIFNSILWMPLVKRLFISRKKQSISLFNDY